MQALAGTFRVVEDIQLSRGCGGDIQLSRGCGEDIQLCQEQKWKVDLETFQLLGLGKL